MKKLILIFLAFPVVAIAQQQVVYTTFVRSDTSTVNAFYFKGKNDTVVYPCFKCMYIQSVYHIDGEAQDKNIVKESYLFDNKKQQLGGVQVLFLKPITQ